MNKYLALAETGRNQWWRYLLAIPAILFFWLSIGSAPILALVLAAELDGNPATFFTRAGEFAGFHPIWMYLATLGSFIPLLLAIFAAVRWIHGRKIITLFTPARRLDWKRLATGFFLWVALAAIASLIEAAAYPGRYRFSFSPADFALFLAVSVIFIPLQTSAEEIFFRGYLLQSIGLRVKKNWLLCLLSGILFTIPHLGNPEVQVNFWLVNAFYFIFGAFMAWITLKDERLELALGAHAGNNFFTAIFANYPEGALRTSPLFTVGVLDPVFGLISSLGIVLVFYLALFAVKKREGDN